MTDELRSLTMMESVIMTMADAQRIASAGLMTEEVHATLRGNLLHCLDEVYVQDVLAEPMKERIILRFDEMKIRMEGDIPW